MKSTVTNRYGDTLRVDTSDECDLIVFRCARRIENAQTLVVDAGVLPKFMRGKQEEGQHVEFICDGPKKREILGSLGVKLCQGPTRSEVAVQLNPPVPEIEIIELRNDSRLIN